MPPLLLTAAFSNVLSFNFHVPIYVFVLTACLQDKSLEKTNVKIDWNKYVDEDEDEPGGTSCGKRLLGRGVNERIFHAIVRRTVDPCIPTMLGRSAPGFHRQDNHCVHQARSILRCPVVGSVFVLFLFLDLINRAHAGGKTLCQTPTWAGGVVCLFII